MAVLVKNSCSFPNAWRLFLLCQGLPGATGEKGEQGSTGQPVRKTNLMAI